MKNHLISLGIWAAIGILTILVWVASLGGILIVGPWDPDRRLGDRCIRCWASAVLKVNPFWQLTVERGAHLDPKRAYVFVSNHQSLADIIVLYHVGHPFKWVAKSSLFHIPFLGWCMGLNRHIKLRRSSTRGIREAMEQATRWLGRGMSVVFFAEGTRSHTGTLGAFKIGAFKLAIQTKTPIAPVVITGTRDALPRGAWVFDHHVHGILTVLPPIETASYQVAESEALKQRVFDAIEQTFKSHSG